MPQPQPQPDQVAEEGGEGDLAQPRQDGHPAQGPDQLHVQLDADQKQQDHDPEFRQQIDLFIGLNDIQGGGAGDQSDSDEGDDQGLT